MAEPPQVPESAEAVSLERDVPVAPAHLDGQLTSRPHSPTVPGPTGTSALGVVTERDTLVVVPTSYRAERPAPLLVVLHGAGGDARSALGLLQAVAEETGAILLAPASRDRTWDVIVGHVGPDISVIDRSLDVTFDRWAIDPFRVVVAGFSDGASYALTVGLANGDLFRHVLAFSPGFASPPVKQGQPRVFVSHGVDDRVLPIRSCSRRLVPALQSAGYDVRYVEFPGGHTVPPDILRDALRWMGLPISVPI